MAAGITALLIASFASATPALPVERTLESALPGKIHLLRYGPAAGRVIIVQENTATIFAVSDGATQASFSFDSKPTALAPGHRSGKALVALGHRNRLAFIGLNSGRLDAEFKSAIDFPSLAVFDDASGNFLVASNRNPGITTVQSNGSAEKTVSTPGPLAALEVTGRGWIFAAASDQAAVYVFDSFSLAELGTFAAPGCGNPSGLALDDMERRLYLTCANGLLMVLDSDTGVVLGRHELPAGTSRVVVRTLEGRTIQALVLAEDASLTVFEGRIMASGIRSIYRGLGETEELQMGKGMGRIFLASGSKISVVALQ